MKQKYIKDAIMWNRYYELGAWVRGRDMNLIKDGDDEYYTPAFSGFGQYRFRDVYPYEDWMEEYIGTAKNLKQDSRFKI